MKLQDGMEELTKTSKEQIFWSVEYTDEDGDLNIKHAVATPIEMAELMDEFIKRGLSAKAYMINPQTKI
jgi:hypothetical protein